MQKKRNPRQKKIIYTKHQLLAHININNLMAQAMQSPKEQTDKIIMPVKKKIIKKNLKVHFNNIITETPDNVYDLTKMLKELDDKREIWIYNTIFL